MDSMETNVTKWTVLKDLSHSVNKSALQGSQSLTADIISTENRDS